LVTWDQLEKLGLSLPKRPMSKKSMAFHDALTAKLEGEKLTARDNVVEPSAKREAYFMPGDDGDMVPVGYKERPVGDPDGPPWPSDQDDQDDQ